MSKKSVSNLAVTNLISSLSLLGSLLSNTNNLFVTEKSDIVKEAEDLFGNDIIEIK